MVILEAWAYGKPVLMTPECNLPEGFARSAALQIGTDVESITAGLRELLGAPASSRQAMGRAGRCLVAQRFTWPKIASEMKAVYDWLVGGGTRPDRVVTN
jgi:poly(glycerol-phosphate) alpha-glucosyltransferase